MQRLAGRVALVTGAAGGIGRATAVRLAREGAAVLLTDVQDEAGQAVADGIRDTRGRAGYLRHDVADEAAWQAAVEQAVHAFGGLDIVVNNAGVLDPATIEQTTLADYQRSIAVNQTGMFLGMKTAGSVLRLSGRGVVVNIGSVFASSGGFGASAAYHAAKGAVQALTRNLAVHWARDGVRVNTVHPGFVDTPILAESKGTHVEETMRAMTPMGRLGHPAEVAACVAFLASDDASFVTGTELYVDGGYHAR